MPSKLIGKISATEKNPTTIDYFLFWTDKSCILKTFDIVKVDHLHGSVTYGVIEEISHMTDAPSAMTSYISSDFGEVSHQGNMHRLGMNLVKAKVIGNTMGIYNPTLDGHSVSLASKDEIMDALGLNNVKNPLPCGLIEMYDGDDKVIIPVDINAHFLIGPEGAHFNISGISGLASKTSYAMFLIKAIQDFYYEKEEETIAFVMLNVKGRDLLAIDELTENQNELEKEIFPMYQMFNEGKERLQRTPFRNVKYFFPYAKDMAAGTYAHKEDVEKALSEKKAKFYKYICDETEGGDQNKIDLLFSNIDDPQGTMDAIITYIVNGEGQFTGISEWNKLLESMGHYTKSGRKDDQSIPVASWRKFYRIFKKVYDKNAGLFAARVDSKKSETRLCESLMNIQPNDCFVIDIAKLDEEMQAFVFGDVMRSIYDLKLGAAEGLGRKAKEKIPSKIIIFIDELNKYASDDSPKNSPILRQILDITERGRSLGVVLFSAEQFRSDIHRRVKGNCATHAYGRTNAIETSKADYQYIPSTIKSMLTRLKQGEYVIQNPTFRSLLSIKFPKPIYKQYKHG
ncbi:ATP-binding protein [Desulfovibrio desulfuricans]|uniref:ATP-binding protein n=1 Tax=Desulfovibrio desulfuricans TaxID=876 RepID=UPI001D06FBAB|nr:ATP-binding protein [Desulfovibrio desulfuricans]MCB6540552.1 ATP-binding protein [Desulfovibrio desulfuricans]MCB6551634.1 ATP-binding protein [Desulfovibrio desulfuricans]MCB6563477.1 ATP-binding protein [Desulfovibrio desulfuricans]MCB7344934.1 ATP-binding protein [Desulfovibrio desulfuricans]MCQ4860084.1 ATP-binding protein [Desulfovibrio desulfuricans]